jgi:hypothetical protein
MGLARTLTRVYREVCFSFVSQAVDESPRFRDIPGPASVYE